MIFKCPYYVHILSNTKNAPRTFFIFFNKELYTILPKFLENSSKFCVKKKCNSPNFLQMRKSFCLNVLNIIMQLCTQDFCLNRIFQQVTFFLTFYVFFAQNDKSRKYATRNTQWRCFLLENLYLF